MIGELPTSLTVNNIERAIRSDYRVALTIFVAYNDVNLFDEEKIFVMLDCLYENVNEIPTEDLQEAIEKAVLFLDGKLEASAPTQNHKNPQKVLDWVQDEQMIFSAINKVAGCEVRSLDYVHWWTFLGYFNEIGEGMLATVMNIRSKKANGKTLEKYEEDYYREHKSMIDLNKRYTEEEQAEIECWNNLLK